ncbi:MAG TPA: M15 family metallopeptidase [Pseudolabrys sp.]|nr:M15 family metallopeptidase [Pseudolabrys sp.]
MMRKRFIATFVFLASSALCLNAARAQDHYGAPPASINDDLDRLVRAYRGTIASHDGTFLTLRNGMRFRISDGRTDKTFTELLESPDIDDMFYARYPAGVEPKQPDVNSDPGRVRFAPLFAAMYGDCRKNEVAKHLRSVQWLPKHNGGSVKMTAVNGAADALSRVSAELDALPGDLVKLLVPAAGTYHCRNVAGSRAVSMHAYGAAIDINTKRADYWRWASGERAAPRWRNRIPVAIVRIFERHGFIWGGAWYHYDTMHFEYRPELLGR